MLHLGLFALGHWAPTQNDFYTRLQVDSDVPSELLIEIERADDLTPVTTVEDRAEDTRVDDVEPSRIDDAAPSRADDAAPSRVDDADTRVAARVDLDGRDVDPAPEPQTREMPSPVSAPIESPAEAESVPAPAPVAAVEAPDPSADAYGEPAGAAVPGVSIAGIGLGGQSPIWSLGGVLGDPNVRPDAAPTTAPRRKAVDSDIATRVLNETLSQRDKELGLDQPAGAIVAGAVADAVRSAPTPDDTKATFEVTVAPGGKVTGSRVVHSTKGTTAMWERAAKGAAVALANQSLAMRGDARTKGATVTITVEAKNVYPAGSKKTIDVRPVCANQVINDLIAADQAKAEGRPTPPPGQGEDSDFCIPIAVAGVGDVSNFGANVQKVVRTTHAVKINGHRDLPAEIHPVNRDAPWIKHRDKPGPRPTLPPEWRRKKKEREKKKGR